MNRIVRLLSSVLMALAIIPCALGVVYGLVNACGGWTWLLPGHDAAFYALQPCGRNLVGGGIGFVAIVLMVWAFVRKRGMAWTDRRQFLKTVVWIYVLAAALRFSFCLFFGRGMANSWDPLWAWERACGVQLSDNRHILFPAWMNYALAMKAFVSIIGRHFWLYQLAETLFSGLTSVFIFLLAREFTPCSKTAVLAGALSIFCLNDIVYQTAGASSEHLAVPLLTAGVYFCVRMLKASAPRSAMGWMLLSGLLLGIGDAVKPFMPIVAPAVVLTAVLSVLTNGVSEGHRRFGRLLTALCLVGVASFSSQGVLVVTERVFSCKLDRADSVPHFLAVGLDPDGEGQIHLGRSACVYQNERLAGLPREVAASRVWSRLKESWQGRYAEIPSFLFKKTIWAWQEHDRGYHYYHWNRSHGKPLPPLLSACAEKICCYGESASLFFYMFTMLFAGFALGCLLRETRNGIAAGPLLLALVILGYFGLMLISESQGRYKCLVMPFVFIFAAMGLGLFIRRLLRKEHYVLEERGFALQGNLSFGRKGTSK